MAALDKGVARRVKQAVERFADTGAGNVKRLQRIDPPETAAAPATTGSASIWKTRPSRFSASRRPMALPPAWRRGWRRSRSR
jgi:hypothetical protein